MQRDFHYYGTYAAARVAGFDEKDATTIAHAAQYVDDHTADLIDKDLLPDWLEPVATSQTRLTVAAHDLMTESAKRALKRLWMSFHFLPGPHSLGYTAGSNPKQDILRDFAFGVCTPLRNDPGGEDPNKKDPNLEKGKNLKLVEKMIDDTMRGNLNLLGLRMHVLADTWAHTYFAGLPNKGVNDVWVDVQEKHGEDWVPVKFGPNHTDQSSPWNPFDESVACLGHARMGSMPDHPWRVYRFKPAWSGVMIEKNNPEDYKRAFRQMVAVMTAYRDGTQDPCGHPSLAAHYEQALANRLGDQSDENKRAQNWHTDMRALFGFAPPPCYSRLQWRDQAKKNADNRRCSDYFLFNEAAVHHQNFVVGHLKSHGYDITG